MLTTIIIISYGVAAFFLGRYIERESNLSVDQYRAELARMIEEKARLNIHPPMILGNYKPEPEVKRKRGRHRKNPVK